jgi:hypothetical protein
VHENAARVYGIIGAATHQGTVGVKFSFDSWSRHADAASRRASREIVSRVKHVLTDSEAFGSPVVESLKWLHPVRPDDAQALRVEVMRAPLNRPRAASAPAVHDLLQSARL